VIRASGTEPVIRVMAEASDPALVRRSVEDIIAALERRGGATAAMPA
jgi:phosphoglucosamine mutase